MKHLIVCSVAPLVFIILQVSALALQLGSLGIDHSQPDTATVAGSTIQLRCRVTGDPKPEFKWLRNGRELTGGRYNTLESGDLQIENVNFLDGGGYTCVGSNDLGSAEATGNLEVKQRTIITNRPEDYEVAAGSAVVFRCSADTDLSLTLTIDWLKNDEPINFEMESKLLRSSDNSLTITNTTALDSGTYTCVARTELDETKAQAVLVVQDVPNPPRLFGVSCGNYEASVRWFPMGDNRAPILQYTVQFNTSFTPDTWETAYLDVPATDQTYNVLMTPWANYTFRVLAWNKLGASLPSPHSEVCTTQPDVPYKNPDNVEVKGTDPTNIVISWTPMPQIEHHAPGFMYRVFYRPDIPGENWYVQDVKDWKQDRLQVYSHPTYQRYKIKVVAVNERGESRVAAHEVTGYSVEDVPLEAPTNLTVEVIDSRLAMLSWNPVSDESIRGNFRGYKIQTWTDKDGEEGLREIHVRADQTEVLVSRFVPYSKNYIRILAYNDRYNSPASETVSFETPEGVPESVQSFDAYPMGSTALYLVWRKPAQTNGILTGYKISYQVVDGTHVGPLLEKVPYVRDPEATRAKLTGLEPNTKYRVHIRAMTEAGEGEDYFIERSTRSIGGTPPAVPYFTWELIPTDGQMAMIRVTWVPNLDGNPGSHFFVKYKLKGETIYQETAPEFNDDTIEVQGLTRGEVYVMSLVAVDGDYLTESLPQDVETSGEGPYIQPE